VLASCQGDDEVVKLRVNITSLEAELVQRKAGFKEDLEDVERRLVDALRELEAVNADNTRVCLT
jgi:hypothetical protein